MPLLSKTFGIQVSDQTGTEENVNGMYQFDALFESIIDSKALRSCEALCEESKWSFSQCDGKYAKLLESPLLKNAHEEEQYKNSRITQAFGATVTSEADEHWLEALDCDLNIAASSNAGSAFSRASQSCISPDVINTVQAPQHSLANSPVSFPSSSFPFQKNFHPSNGCKNQRFISSPHFTPRTDPSYETSFAKMNIICQPLPLDAYSRQENVYNHHTRPFSGQYLSLPSNLGLNHSKYDISLNLSSIGNGYVQHPNTPISTPPLLNQNSSSNSSLEVNSMELRLQNQVQDHLSAMNYTQVDPQSFLLAPTPTRPAIQSCSSWIPDDFGTGQSEIHGRGGSNGPEIKAEPGWPYNDDSIVGAQNPSNHQQNQPGRTTSSSNLGELGLGIVEPAGGVVGMPGPNGIPMRHGDMIKANNMHRPNHPSARNSASASSTSRSCPNLQLPPTAVDYRELAAQQKRQTQLLSQAWSPNDVGFSEMPNETHDSLHLPIRNTSRHSGTNSQPKVAGRRPASLSIPRKAVERSPSPCRSPGHGNGNGIQSPGRRCRSSGHHRRKSSCGASCASPRHATGGFVNLTPLDHQKILTGVAPSGSSKTKARREKEEKERIRKVSKAAENLLLQAVEGQDLGIVKKGLQRLTSTT